MNEPESFDVAIIGGGPAGATAGAMLARQGKKVVIFEKERFPRFSIGESLLPHGNDLLKQIGVWEKIENSGFLKKYGPSFVREIEAACNVSGSGEILGRNTSIAIKSNAPSLTNFCSIMRASAAVSSGRRRG